MVDMCVSDTHESNLVWVQIPSWAPFFLLFSRISATLIADILYSLWHKKSNDNMSSILHIQIGKSSELRSQQRNMSKQQSIVVSEISSEYGLLKNCELERKRLPLHSKYRRNQNDMSQIFVMSMSGKYHTALLFLS